MSSPTLAPVINATGISAPSYDTILASLTESFQSIYGTDINVDPDTQDGQFLALLALVIKNNNDAIIADYNSFSPTYSQGAGLSSLVKINGLQRQIPSSSSVILHIVGTVGTTINNGIAQDVNAVLWNLPALVTIPAAGFIDVTATCSEQGAIAAPANTIQTIFTPTAGWQTVNNVNPAVLGQPVETDAQLRQRQSVSTSLPSQSPAEGILAAVENLTGVTRAAIYENPTGSTDSNGVPAHSIAVVVAGGNATVILQTIALKKTLGTGTYGSTTQTVIDQAGYSTSISYFPLTLVEIYVTVSIHALTGFTSTTEAVIQQALQTFIQSLAIGETVYIAWVTAIAQLISSPLGETFKVTAVAQGTSPSPVGTSDIAIAFNNAADVAALTQIVINLV